MASADAPDDERHASLALQLPLPAGFDGVLTVAYSGGLDSTVLLHATRRWAQERSIHVEALHVHHGLQPAADAWAGHCQSQASAWGITCTTVHVTVVRQPRQSLEEAAREARYAAFAAHARPGALLLAHHQQDQVETVVMRLARGSGALGLGGMAAHRPVRADLLLMRPLLAVPRAVLAAYARHHQLAWIDDPSNDTLQFTRNRVRHQLLPSWREMMPQIDEALVRVAAHCRDAASIMDDMAQWDLQQIQQADGRLSGASLGRLSAARQRNVLRHWLMADGALPPASSALDDLMQQIQHASGDAQPQIVLGRWTVRRYQDCWYRSLSAAPVEPCCMAWPDIHLSLDLPAGLGTLILADGGDLRRPQPHETVSVRFGLAGSTRCHPQTRHHGRELVKLWQEYHVAPWQRGRVPMLFYGERLVAAIGYWIERDHAVVPGSGVAPVLQAPANASRR